ncbi:MOSC domain-containing protein [bacterium]|nr:MAG: MOSC domain-containing protein [bacterium]
MFKGELVAIYIAPQKAKPLTSVGTVKAVAGQGLEGDRYFHKAGTFTKVHEPNRPDRQVTLIEEEALAAAAAAGSDVKPELSRRNLLTRGVPLNHLVGREFLVGKVRLRGLLLCEPCKHLEALSVPGARERLIHRGGLRAEILAGGVLSVGDSIVPS